MLFRRRQKDRQALSRLTRWALDESVPQSELERMLAEGRFNASSVAMIQCVGCRNEERPYCSRICCSSAMKNALKIKELKPETAVYIINKDIRTYGFREDYARMAAEKGVITIRYDDEHKPAVTEKGGAIEIRLRDMNGVDDGITLNPELLVLSAAIVSRESNEAVAQMLKVPLNGDGFFLEAHMKLRPVDFATEGIFLCGMAHSPRFIDESISQAYGTAARAMTILSKDYLESEGS